MNDTKKKNDEMVSEKAAKDLADFLRDSEQKEEFMSFVVESYKNFENQRLSREKSKLENQKESDSISGEDYHSPGNIAHLISKDLSMSRSEHAVARGVGVTKEVLNKTLEERVGDIRKLLAGIGGFSSQLKSCFARSTVVFLQQDDPEYDYRERLIFSINLPKFELKHSWEQDQEGLGEGTDEGIKIEWDDAVNALAAIIEGVGLNAKYCKNDRKYRQFTMKQDLRSQLTLPDEYFSIVLDYIDQEKIAETGAAYNEVVTSYESKIKKLEKKLRKLDPTSEKYQKFFSHKCELVQERDFFIATVPDPGQIDEGLLLYIDVSTLKDYYIVKNKIQTVMTKFILHLSKIATKAAEFDPELEYELWKNSESDKENVPVHAGKSYEYYKVDPSALTPLKKKAA